MRAESWTRHQRAQRRSRLVTNHLLVNIRCSNVVHLKHELLLQVLETPLDLLECSFANLVLPLPLQILDKLLPLLVVLFDDLLA